MGRTKLSVTARGQVMERSYDAVRRDFAAVVRPA